MRRVNNMHMGRTRVQERALTRAREKDNARRANNMHRERTKLQEREHARARERERQREKSKQYA